MLKFKRVSLLETGPYFSNVQILPRAQAHVQQSCRALGAHTLLKNQDYLPGVQKGGLGQAALPCHGGLLQEVGLRVEGFTACECTSSLLDGKVLQRRWEHFFEEWLSPGPGLAAGKPAARCCILMIILHASFNLHILLCLIHIMSSH